MTRALLLIALLSFSVVAVPHVGADASRHGVVVIDGVLNCVEAVVYSPGPLAWRVTVTYSDGIQNVRSFNTLGGANRLDTCGIADCGYSYSPIVTIDLSAKSSLQSSYQTVITETFPCIA